MFPALSRYTALTRCAPPKLTVGVVALAEFSNVSVSVGLPAADTAKSTVLVVTPAVALTVAAPVAVGPLELMLTVATPLELVSADATDNMAPDAPLVTLKLTAVLTMGLLAPSRYTARILCPPL